MRKFIVTYKRFSDYINTERIFWVEFMFMKLERLKFIDFYLKRIKPKANKPTNNLIQLKPK